MRNLRLVVPTAIATSALLLSAGGSAGAASSRPAGDAHHGPAAQATAGKAKAPSLQHVTIVGTNQLQFKPPIVHLHVGRVEITLKDAGAYPHNIVIPALHVTSSSVTGDPGGTTIHLIVRFPRKGRYPFHCQYHQSAGMVGTFVVS